jgi:serine/threonine-protein kinase
MHPTISCARCGGAVGETDAFCSSCGFARSQPHDTVGARRALRGDPLLDALRTITFGEYDIGGRLGAGGMASVYLAHELRLSRRVAIKAMLPEWIDSENMVQRFFDEARKQARLEHPNIVPIHSLHWDADVPFFVMKFVDGFSAEDVVQARGALPVPVVQHILASTIAGLQYAHDEGVIHRDVKPGNVLIDRRGQPIVSDFGIAKAAESPHLTQTGAPIGTPTYMSPEQCRGLPVTAASDQYSVGVLAFQLLTGSTPFTGSMLELLQAHAVDAPPSIAARRSDCPPRLAAAVMRMLEKAPEDRWPELRDALPDIVAGFGNEAEVRRQLVALFPDRPTAAESLPLTPRSPTPASSKARKKSAPTINLIVAPANGSWELRVGETVRMTTRRSGDISGGQPASRVVWETSDDDVASVSADGQVTAHVPGDVSIIATDGQLKGRCEMTVIPADEITVGQTDQMTVVPTNRNSGQKTRTLFVPSVSKNAPSTVAADPSPMGQPETEIAPRVLGAERDVVATPPATPKRGLRRPVVIAGTCAAAIAAFAFYGMRNRGPSTAPPTSAKPDSAVVKPDTTTAPVQAATPVAAPTAARVSLLLSRTSLRVGDSARVTVRVFDSSGTRMPNVPIALTSSEPRIVKVDSSGRMIALAKGTATITGQSGSVGKSETVTVDERLIPLSPAEATDALTALLVSASNERWGELQDVLRPDVLNAFKGKRGIEAKLSGELLITSGVESATVEFDVAMNWHTIARLGRSGVAPLRATFVRDGKGWRVKEIIARDKLP